MTTDRLSDLLAATDQAVRAYGRDDLADRLAGVRAGVEDSTCHVMVVGEYKQGKSSLVNALLNASICPVDVDIATSVPTVVRNAAEQRAEVAWVDGEGGEHTDDIALGSIAEVALGIPDGALADRVVRSIEVGLPRRMLETGLRLVDTPGVGGVASAHRASTLAVLPDARAAVFVTDASRELSGSEIRFLESVRAACPMTIGVMTKIDFYPHWRTVLDRNRTLLAERSVEVELHPVSSVLRRRAIAATDAAMNDESGYSPVIASLHRIVADDRRTARAGAGDAMAEILLDLRLDVSTQLEVLRDPAHADRLIADLSAASAAVERLRADGTAWQTTLNDGLTDLTSEIDHDLRGRFRALLHEIDARLDDADPAAIWGDFELWLSERVGEEISANVQLLRSRGIELSERVAGRFTAEIDAVDAVVRAEAMRPDRMADRPDYVRKSAAAKSLTLARGSLGGIMLFGMFANLAGLALLGPVAPVVGLLLGRRAIREERERDVVQRRQQAKAACRRYIDEVLAGAGKESRDAVRRIGRELRDHFSMAAAELVADANATLSAARQAVESRPSDPERRAAQLEADVGRIDRLAELVAELNAGGVEE